MALTDTAIRLAKSEASDRKLADSKGLYLLVTASGSKLWRLKYRIDGKEKKLALGSYPEVGLKDARARRDAARQSAQAGCDPSIAKREARIAKRIAAANIFGGIVEEYIAKLEAEGKAAVTIAKTRWLFDQAVTGIGHATDRGNQPALIAGRAEKGRARGAARDGATLAAHGIRAGRDERARLSLDRFVAAERKRQMERRRDRAGPVARRCQSGPRGLSSRRALARTGQNGGATISIL